MSDEPRVVVRRWAFGRLRVFVENGPAKMASIHRNRSRAMGAAVGLAYALSIPIHDATGLYSDAECAELVKAFGGEA